MKFTEWVKDLELNYLMGITTVMTFEDKDCVCFIVLGLAPVHLFNVLSYCPLVFEGEASSS